MGFLQKATAKLVRQGVIEMPKNAPAWMSPEYVARCMEYPETRGGWRPRVGDWYVCVDLQRVLKIEGLGRYYTDPPLGSPAVLPSDSHIDSCGRWPCDTYIPDQKTRTER